MSNLCLIININKLPIKVATTAKKNIYINKSIYQIVGYYKSVNNLCVSNTIRQFNQIIALELTRKFLVAYNDRYAKQLARSLSFRFDVAC